MVSHMETFPDHDYTSTNTKLACVESQPQWKQLSLIRALFYNEHEIHV